MNPGPIYPVAEYPWQVTAFAWIASLLLLVTVVASFMAWQKHKPSIAYALGGVWAIGPPIWFWYEYFFVYRVFGYKEQFEYFKYGQQVSIAIWAGVALALFALATSDHLKPKQSNKR